MKDSVSQMQGFVFGVVDPAALHNAWVWPSCKILAQI